MLLNSGSGKSPITVICDDTDVFVLLLYFYKQKSLKCEVFLEETSKERKLVSIGETIENLKSQGIMDILPLHDLTGCDTVSGLFNSETIICTTKNLNFLGEISNSNFDEVYTRCVNFMSKCYGRTLCDTMNNLRYKYWAKLIGGAKSLCPPLEHLPPTDASFREHVKRAICQLNIWENADKVQSDDSVHVNLLGWFVVGNQLMPIVTPDNTAVAPDFVLKLIKCACKSASDRCMTRKCSCAAHSLKCTKFCSCSLGGVNCTHSNENNYTGMDENEDVLD